MPLREDYRCRVRSRSRLHGESYDGDDENPRKTKRYSEVSMFYSKNHFYNNQVLNEPKKKNNKFFKFIIFCLFVCFTILLPDYYL